MRVRSACGEVVKSMCNCLDGTVPQTTIDRLRETFRRLSTSSGYLPQATFIRDVLGETVPAKLAEVSLPP